MALRDQILNAKDLRAETVHVPEWGVDVLVQSMTSGERGEVLEVVRDAAGNVRLGKLQILMVLKCAKDPETKQRVFEDSDYDVLASKAAGAVERIALAALRVSGLGDQAQEIAEKNLPAASDGDTSGSPAS